MPKGLGFATTRMQYIIGGCGAKAAPKKMPGVYLFLLAMTRGVVCVGVSVHVPEHTTSRGGGYVNKWVADSKE